MPLTYKPVHADEVLLSEVIALSDRHRKTLGFMPWSGFHEAAARNTILVAVSESGQVAGYCLFDLPGNYIRITHLCVDQEFRGQQIARRLIDLVSGNYPTRMGLKVSCRADWPADKMWSKLGFIPRSQRKGRSKEGHLLTLWWRSHGHADLFTDLLDSNTGTRVAIDSNVYSDLHTKSTRAGAHHSAALAPLIANQQIKIVVCPQVSGEVYATPDQRVRQRLLGALPFYDVVTDEDADSQTLREELLALVDPSLLVKDPSLRSDAQLIAEAIRADVEVIVTRDERLVASFADYVHEKYGVSVINPSEIQSVLDAGESPYAYLPAQLRATGYVTSKPLPQQWRWDSMQRFLDRAGGESKTEFTETLRATASNSAHDSGRVVLADDTGQARAAWVASAEADVLRVPFLRVAAESLSVTIAKILTLHLRQVAVDSKCSSIQVTDPFCPREVLAVLESDGFVSDGSSRVASVMARCISAADPGDLVGTSGSHLTAEEAAELERLHWPLRILGAGIPSYLVPIHGPLASDLLGYPASLLAMPDFLGLSREHVYYKSDSGVRPKTPGRILWYASHSPQQIIGCSRLTEVITGNPGNLYRRFARFGVYTAAAVRQTGGQPSRVRVLRFSDTELFSNPVSLPRLRALALGHSERLTPVLRSMSKIDDELFGLIYREGTGRSPP